MTEQQPEQNEVRPDTGAVGDAGNAGDAEEQGEQLVLTSPEDARTPKELALWAGVILLAALTIYSPALSGDFLWDDDRHVSANRNLRDFPGLVNIWTKLGITRGGTIQYYPLTHTTFWLEYQLSGAQPGRINTTVFHVTNVVLHVIGAILLWLVLRELKVPGSWVAAAIWALHPLQVESVAWISERKNVLAGVFFFGAILAYIKAAGIGEGSGFGLAGSGNTDAREELGSSSLNPAPRTLNPSFYWLALGLFVCALLSKTVTASMPAVVLLLIWWKRGRLTARDFAAAAPFFVVGLGMAAVTAWLERTQVGARGPEWESITLPQRVLIAGRAVWFYVQKNLAPLRLSFIYPRWNIAAAPSAWWAFPAAVVAVIAALFALRNRISRGPLVAFLIFCGVLLPALGFVSFYPMRYSFVADHFQYLAGPALIALVVAGVAALLRRVAPRATAAPYVIAGLALVVLSALTLLQARVYAGPLLLWDDAIRKNPTEPMLRHNYGVDLTVLMDQLPPEQAAPFVDEAIKQFEEAVKLNPRHERAWTMMGRALLFRGRPEDALNSFGQALKLRPDSIDALVGRAQALYDLKRYDESERVYREALAAAQAQRAGGGAVPRIVVATIYQYLGRIAMARDDLDTAARHYAEAVDVVGDNSAIRYEYGRVLSRQAKLADAAATQPTTQAGADPLTTAPVPTSPVAVTQSAAGQPATTRAATGPSTQPAERAKALRAAAAAQLAEAVELRPGFVDAHMLLAELMMDVGNLRGAQTQLTAAVAANGNTPNPALEAAVKRWDAELRKREAAATQSSTAPATTQPTAPATTPASAMKVTQ